MKRVITWHGKKYYYLGVMDGEPAYLQEATFDCGWYWGIGYVETFTNERQPERSRDISMHTHFDYLMDSQRNQFGGTMNWWDAFKNVFRTTLLKDSEIWTVVEIMKSLYTARKYSDMIHRGGSNYTSNPVAETINNDTEYKRINEKVIPALLDALYKILDGTGIKEE